MNTKTVACHGFLNRPLNGHNTLKEAIIAELKQKYGDNIQVDFYFGLPNGMKLDVLAGKLLGFVPEVILCAKVTIG